jgi:hypothetical protein
MKRYKKYFLAIAIASSLGMISSCNDDDFLVEKTETSYTYSNAFTVSSQVKDCLTEIYYAHKKFIFPDRDSWREQFLVGIGTDILDYPQTEASAVSNFSNWSITYDKPLKIFTDLYGLIARANLVLLGAEKVSWSDENEKKQAIAQARFFRGYGYMNLAELFGGVPITEEFFEKPKFDFQRASREDTYLYAIGELEAAATVLPEHQTPGRVGKGIAYHYLAESYLALATIKNNDSATLDKAISAAGEVIKRHALMKERFGKRANPASTDVNNRVSAYFPNGDVFFDLFQRGNYDYEEGNTESLWVCQNNWASYDEYGNVGGIMSFMAFTQACKNALWKPEWKEPSAQGGPWDTGDVGNDEWGYNMNRSAYTGGKGQNRIEPTVFAKNTVWNNCGGDIRNSSVNIRRKFPVYSLKHSMYGDSIHVDEAEKYFTEPTQHYLYPVHTKIAPIDNWGWEGMAKNEYTFTTHDCYYARLAETYLLRAEAHLRKGSKAAAASDINEVRGRAHAPLASEAEITLDYILDERVRELCYEERRWCTLLRMGGNIPNDRITKYARMIADYHLWSGTLAQDFLLPIPQQIIDSNLDGVIEQNPMWK